MYPYSYPYPYSVNYDDYRHLPGYNYYPASPGYQQHVTPNYSNQESYRETLRDYGPNPFVIDINSAAKQNNTYRTAIWTGPHIQITLMSLNVGEDIGLEVHPNLDQFLRVEQGRGVVQMGNTKENLSFVRNVHPGSAIAVPAGTWHNVTNTGNTPLKLYSIYAPPNHPFGTVHPTKADAMSER